MGRPKTHLLPIPEVTVFGIDKGEDSVLVGLRLDLKGTKGVESRESDLCFCSGPLEQTVKQTNPEDNKLF
jgi:hypothetical protein